MEQSWWNSVVEKWNSHGGNSKVDSETVRWYSVVEQWNSHGGTVWWKSGTVMVEQWNTNSGTVWWNSGTVMVEQCGGTVEH